jgi:hypothetical protein
MVLLTTSQGSTGMREENVPTLGRRRAGIGAAIDGLSASKQLLILGQPSIWSRTALQFRTAEPPKVTITLQNSA